MGDHVPFPARLRADATGDHAWLAEVADELDELHEALIDAQDRNEGTAKYAAACREVATMRQLGFWFRWDRGGLDMWVGDGSASQPAHELCRVVTMQIAEAVHDAR